MRINVHGTIDGSVAVVPHVANVERGGKTVCATQRIGVRAPIAFIAAFLVGFSKVLLAA